MTAEEHLKAIVADLTINVATARGRADELAAQNATLHQRIAALEQRLEKFEPKNKPVAKDGAADKPPNGAAATA